MLGVWLAGAAWVPLDPAWPAARLGFILADSGAALVITGAAAAARLPAGTAARPVILDDPPVAAALAGDAPAPAPGGPGCPPPGQLAYVIYTSGSTGTPKGVQVGHGALVNYVARCPAAYPGLGGDTLLHAPATFDAAVTVLWGALAAGGRVHIAALDEDLPGAAGREGTGPYAFVKLTPGLLPALAAIGGICAPGGQLMTGGDAVPPAAVRHWRAAHPAMTVINHYGPTEATVGCADYQARPGAALPPGPVPAGRPVWNTAARVLDDQLRPVPAGIPGELYVGGAQLARGYAGRPALTAGRFIADPLAADGSRMYATGDRARWRPGGLLELLGRADGQVKIRGHRIEPAEVEAVLAAHPAIAAAAVAADGDGPGRRLAAWLVPGPAAQVPAADALRAFAARQLPGHMIPAVFTTLDALPVTPHGKLDRAALPAPAATRPGLAVPYTPPATPAEELLAAIWAAALHLDRPGTRDSFFDLGGHSLLATQVISRIRTTFSTDIPLAALFDHPTITELAAFIEDRISQEIEQMSEDEVLQALDMRVGGPNPAEDGAF
jgi:amino acid adenylation domain-containing protein